MLLPTQISAVVGDEQLAAENMNLLRAVGQASRFDSRVVALSYKGGPADEPPIVLVGKV
jgi:leucyl aminopeptidase